MSLVKCGKVVHLKLKIPEEHYLRPIQLYMPWKNKNKLKQDNQTYEDRYKEV